MGRDIRDRDKRIDRRGKTPSVNEMQSKRSETINQNFDTWLEIPFYITHPSVGLGVTYDRGLHQYTSPRTRKKRNAVPTFPADALTKIYN